MDYNISDLTGIEDFINLDHLQIRNNNLKEINISSLKKLKTITKLLDNFLDEQACNAYSIGEIRSLDWRMSVDSETNFLTLRNWPIQSCGADILHRGCIALHASSIPVLLTNHDSFLILVDDKNAKETILLAERLLLDASAEVLDGYQLKIKIIVLVVDLNSGVFRQLAVAIFMLTSLVFCKKNIERFSFNAVAGMNICVELTLIR